MNIAAENTDPFERLAELATTVNAAVDPARALPLVARFAAGLSGAAGAVIVPRQPWPGERPPRETSWSDDRLVFSPADAQHILAAIGPQPALAQLTRDARADIDAALWPPGTVAVTVLAGDPLLDIVCFHAEAPPARPARDALRHAAPLAAGLVERMHRRGVASAALRRFRDFAEISGDWLWETDAEHRFTYLENLSNGSRSERPDQLLGMTRWQLAGSSLEDPRWREHKADLDAHRPFSGLEYTSGRAGKGRVFESNGRPRFAADGTFLGYRGVSRDISALRAAETRAARQEGRFRSIVRTTAEGVVVLDAEGCIGYANQRFAEMLGRTIEELGGVAMAPFVSDGTAFVAMIAEPPLRPVELELSRADGTALSVMVSMRPMRAEGYDTDGTLVMVSDISAHKQAQASLSETRDNLRYLFANNPNPMWVVDEESLRFVSVNAAAIAAYGYGREEFFGMRLSDIRPPEDVARVVDAISAGRAPRGGIELWRHRTKAGDIRDVEVTPYRIVYEGKPAWLSLVRDVTEKRRAEARLAETEEKLRRAQRLEAIGQLADGIAHEFNNALAVILGNTEILVEEVGTVPAAREPLAAIGEAGERGAELISHLLAFSRSASSAPRTLPVSAAMAAIEPILRRFLPKNIELELSSADDAWPIHVDQSQLETAMLNLVSNARDAMPEGGHVLIDIDNHGPGEAAAAEYDTPVVGDHVRIRVTDTGCGMTPDVLRRAFEPFFTTKRVGRGSGLGLSMVYGFARQSGGSIDIASSPDTGTTVTLLLPRARPARASTVQAA
ncbi:MAG: PAS domain S-box protein [Reyranellaceae bacterium]